MYLTCASIRFILILVDCLFLWYTHGDIDSDRKMTQRKYRRVPVALSETALLF